MDPGINKIYGMYIEKGHCDTLVWFGLLCLRSRYSRQHQNFRIFEISVFVLVRLLRPELVPEVQDLKSSLDLTGVHGRVQILRQELKPPHLYGVNPIKVCGFPIAPFIISIYTGCCIRLNILEHNAFMGIFLLMLLLLLLLYVCVLDYHIIISVMSVRLPLPLVTSKGLN